MVSHIDDETPDPLLDERVRSVLDALAAPTEPGPLPGEVDAVAAFRAQHRTRRSSMSHLTPFRVAMASAVGAGLFLTGGVAAAATGSLPGAAQDVAHDVIAALPLDFDVPAGEKAPEQADERRTADAEEETAEVEETQENEVQPEDNDANDHGETVSDLAQNTDATGREKGELIAGTASEGRSTTGQETADAARSDRGKATAGPETGQARSAEAKQKSAGDVADDDSAAEEDTEDGTGVDGAETAGAASGGRSTSGSDNGGRP